MNPVIPQIRSINFHSLIALLAILPTTTFADSSFDGFYFGLAAGGTETQADIDANQTAIFANSSNPDAFYYFRDFNIDNSPDSYHESGIGELRFGYGETFQSMPLYLGLEIFGNIADRKIDSTTENTSLIDPGYYLRESTVNTNLDIKLNDAEYGVDFRPGVLLSPGTLFYARIGAAANKITMNVNNYLSDSFANTPNPPITTSQNETTGNENTLGLRLGVGLESAITSALTLTADYIYTDYGSVQANGSFDVNNPDGTVTENGFVTNTSADVQSQAIMLGFNYYLQENDNDTINDINPSELSAFNGFYSGIKGGLLVSNSKLDTFTSETFDPQFSFDPIDVTDEFSESIHLWDNTAIGEVFAGYGHLIGDSLFYAAVEIFGNLGERKLSEDNSQTYMDSNFMDDPVNPFTTVTISSDTQVKLNPLEWGGDAKLGRFLSDTTLLYGRVGFAVNELTTSSDNLFSFIVNVFDDTLRYSNLDVEESKDVLGLRLGLGLEQMIWDNLAITADYIYTDYGNQKIYGTADVEGVFGEITEDGFVNTTEADMHTHVVMLGLAYHW